MSTLRPTTKIVIVGAGLVAALMIGIVSVFVRHRLFPLPPEEANGGMAAFGDLLQVIAVSGVTALGPLALTLYWLRAVERFWVTLQRGAALVAASGWLALAGFVVWRRSANGWVDVSLARIGLMPLNALAFATCAAFAPRVRQRWWMFASGVSDGLMFVGYLLASGALASILGR